MKLKKLLAMLLALTLVFGLTACQSSGTEQPAEIPSDNISESPEIPSEVPSEPVASKPVVNFAVLSGPTGVGAAKLLSDADHGFSVNDYEYIIAAENNELVAGLSNGEIDIAAVASNVAVNLYNKTEGGVKIIALGTLGVLHILEGSGGTSIQSVSDLAGKTIYSPGQGANPEYILRYVLSQNGIDPDADVTIVFADASEIQAKLLSGEIECAMLPVPAATAAIIKGQGQVRAAIDVTQAWNEVGNGSQLVMTAVVARTEFIEENPEAVSSFLVEYAASIDYVNNNAEAAAELIAGYGITPNAAIAQKAIPQCHLVCISGTDMESAISDYFEILYSMNPAAIGGALPGSDIFYLP